MDGISNMIIAIKNAGFSGHESVSMPYSKLKQSIADVLKKERFIKSSEVRTEKGKKILTISLFSENRVPKIKGVKRISKPSKRIYKKAFEMRPVKSGYGALIVSTSSGVMSGRDAKKSSLGGEALFTIW
ncbi:MAG: 30S ribosomal protein S8 [Patescibacteria group bacterium]